MNMNSTHPAQMRHKGGALTHLGYFDLATPYYAVEYTFNHMGLHPEMHKNITWSFYQAGHMLYIDGDSHTKLKHDAGEFLSNALPKRDAQ
jgi:carboxypeptidase C (cathepsin A)